MPFFKSLETIPVDADAVFAELCEAGNRMAIKEIGDHTFLECLGPLNGKCGIYAIFSDGDVIYFGKTRSAAKRLRDHFDKCSPSTRSKIKEMDALLRSGCRIEVSFVVVPFSIYSAIEEALIEKTKRIPGLNQRAS